MLDEDELRHRLETIMDMREIDPATGQPKHTQTEVAEELGLTKGRISQMEHAFDIQPTQISYENDRSIEDILESRKSGMEIRRNPESTVQRESGESDGGRGMSEEEEPESQSESESEENWVCTSCGNDTYYSAKDYLNKYGSELTQEHIQSLTEASRVCASCGTIE